MNTFIFTGNLTRDPEPLTTPNGINYCRFSVAVKRPQSDETDFFDCTAWRTLADNIEKYCKKGDKVLVTGTVQLRKYEKDGVKRTAIEITAREVEFIGYKARDDESKANTQGKAKTAQKPNMSVYEDEGDDPF